MDSQDSSSPSIVYEQLVLYEDQNLDMMSIPGKWQAFMVAIRWKDLHKKPCTPYYTEFLTYLKKLALEEKIGHTIIGFEISKTSHLETDGQHIHVFTWMTDKTYHTLTQVLFKKWNLRGRAEKDKPRQYGKIKKIRSKDKMIAYTIKGRDILTTFEKNYLKKYLDISYVTEEPVNDMKMKVLERFSDYTPTLDEVGPFIIDYHRQQNLRVPSLSYIKNVYTSYQYDIKADGEYLYNPTQLWNIIKLKL